MRHLRIFLLGLSLLIGMGLSAQEKAFKVIIDNDFCGDPDGLFALAHLVLTEGCDVRGIIGGHLGGKGGGFLPDSADAAKASCAKAKELLDVMNMSLDYKIVPGSPTPMVSYKEPVSSQGSNLIVREALACSPENPLFVLCGGSLTNIASAYLENNAIEDNVILIWIGGPEHDFGSPVGKGLGTEYNIALDIPAARTVFRLSDMRIWQVPRDAYRQCIFSMAQMKELKKSGKLGAYLYDSVFSLLEDMKKGGAPTRDTYVLGDNPLVLLSALQTYFDPDTASSSYELVPAPGIDKNGGYDLRYEGREIRVYRTLDTRLMFSDMVARIKNFEN